MINLAVDVETTGFIINNKKLSDSAQPHIVQIGAILFDDNDNVKSEINLIIKPDGWTIPEEVSKIHGIRTEDAIRFGVPIEIAINLFNRMARITDRVITHNYDFDSQVLECEYIRLNRHPEFKDKIKCCTMKASKELVGAIGKNGLKFPKLQEAYKFLFGSEFEDAHSAFADTLACKRVFLELMRRGIDVDIKEKS